MSYIGRYAPSPSGPLHFGSLVAAIASYLEACSNNGLWLLRIDDLDTPRTMAGAAENILRTLEAFGFEWHGEIVYQSKRTAAYFDAFEALSQRDLIYPCACTRKEIADSATQGIDGFIYPGTCREGISHQKEHYAWRIKSAPINIEVNDAIQGYISQNIGTDIGDFVLKRADGLFTYQLATVIDDAHQGITHILRGADLLDSTPRQVYLQKMLNIAQSEYAHIPVATHAYGQKLSKQTLATGLDVQQVSALLWQALDFLGQNPPLTLKHEITRQVWQWAKLNWQLDHVPKQRTINITKYLT